MQINEADVAELVDARDLKSLATAWIRKTIVETSAPLTPPKTMLPAPVWKHQTAAHDGRKSEKFVSHLWRCFLPGWHSQSDSANAAHHRAKRSPSGTCSLRDAAN